MVFHPKLVNRSFLTDLCISNFWSFFHVLIKKIAKFNSTEFHQPHSTPTRKKGSNMVDNDYMGPFLNREKSQINKVKLI